MKEIIAQFSSESSQALRSGKPNPASRDVLAVLHEAGASIEPLHLGSDDPVLSRYFVIRVAANEDDEKAEELARRLRSLGPTEAAYIKPHEEAP